MKIIFLKRSPTESDRQKSEKHFFTSTKIPIFQMAEGVGFEPTLGLLLSLISSGNFIFFLFTENFHQVKSA
jgi:hypothetical protein